ncbi:MAG: flagellar biosynthesis protein FlhF [Bdellovibrionales bacterium]
MQVKKFEAKNMKEALELVKRHLGPEAIILSAKDNSRGFGIAGQKSVEVTAAISEETLRRKRLAESKLSQSLKERFDQVPARQQRNFIDKANTVTEAPAPRPKPMRYAEIMDEDQGAMPMAAHSAVAAEQRVKSAAQRAFQAMNEAAVVPTPVPAPITRPLAVSRSATEPVEIRDLKAEILNLRKIIESFQKIPQSFVTMHPGADAGISYELSGMYQKLLRAGIGNDNAIEILKHAQNTLAKEQLQKPAFVDAWVARYLMDQTQIADQRTANRYHLFIGSAGQGKTSALVKLAGHMVICEKKRIAIVTTDTTRVGSSEQLRIYAQILNVPFAIIRQPSDWAEVRTRLAHAEHILVDYPGLNLKSIQEVDTIRSLMPSGEGGVSTHYVQSVLANDESAFETASRYQMIGFSDVIFTGLDEAAQHGLIYNFQKRFQVPLHSFGIGNQIPEDLEPATKERVVDLLFKLSKLRKDKAP